MPAPSATRASASTGGPAGDTGSLRRRRSRPATKRRTITKCVESILRSAAAAGLAHDRFELVVVADSCTDATAAIARRAVGGLGVVVEARAGSVGQARAIGTSRALARWVARPSTVWTVHTDADSVVPEGWLHHQRRVAEVGFAAVAGVVEVASFAEHSARTARRHHRKYSGCRGRPSPRPRRQPRRARRRLSRRRRLVGDRQWRGPRAVERRPPRRVPDAVDPVHPCRHERPARRSRPRRFRRPPALAR